MTLINSSLKTKTRVNENMAEDLQDLLSESPTLIRASFFEEIMFMTSPATIRTEVGNVVKNAFRWMLFLLGIYFFIRTRFLLIVVTLISTIIYRNDLDEKNMALFYLSTCALFIEIFILMIAI